MSASNEFVRGAILLTGAALVSKVLGSVYTIVLQNVIGDRGMGLFQMAYPVYATVLAIATAGFPVAISKLVSERVALRDVQGARQVLQTATSLLIFAGIAAFCTLFFAPGLWARMAGDPAAATAIRAIAPALLIVPILSVLRGYYQGHQWMEPTAVSQVVEQVVRVVTIIGLAVWLIHAGYGMSTVVAGAAFGAVTGAFAGLLVLLHYRRRHGLVAGIQRGKSKSTWQWTKRLLYDAFPISLGALVMPLMHNVDVITVVNLLKHSGVAQAVATTDFGLLSGRAYKLMMLPTTLAAGIGIAVMPAVSAAVALGRDEQLASRVDMAVRLTVMLALPAGGGLALLARPIDIALFENARGVGVIQVMALATLFASLQTVVSAVLQGSGWMYAPVLYLILAAVMKAAANWSWVTHFGIAGAAWSTVVSYGLAAALNFWGLRRRFQASIPWGRWFGGPLLATFIMAGFVFAMERQWELWGGLHGNRWVVGLFSLGIVQVGMVIYGLVLLLTGAMAERDLRSVPRVGDRAADWCIRFGVLRSGDAG